MSLIVVGYIARDVVRQRGDELESLGGAATYFALAASIFGDVRIVAPVGHDLRRDAIRILTQRRVDVSGIAHLSGPTMRWSVRYDAEGQERTITDVQLGVARTFEPRFSVTNVDTVFVGAAHPDQQRRALACANGAALVALDTSPEWTGDHREEVLALAASTDVFFASTLEALELTGAERPEDAARRLLGGRTSAVVVKRGEKGALVLSGAGAVHVAASRVAGPVDATGAGDAFAAGFLASLGPRPDWHDPQLIERAGSVGAAVAAQTIESHGPFGLIGIEREDIDARIARTSDADPAAAPPRREIVKLGLAVVREGRLLLCRPYRHPALILPGGEREGDEAPEVGLAREIGEELGGRARLDPASLRWFGTFRDAAAGRPGVTVRIDLYLGRLVGDPSPSHEIAELTWFSPAEPDDHELSPIVANHIIPRLQDAGLLER